MTDIKLEHISPFLVSCSEIFTSFGLSDVRKGKLGLHDKHIACKDVAILVGVVGQLEGSVLYSFSKDEALKLASAMMGGMPVLEFDEMIQSAISELTNMLTARAVMEFENLGFSVNITPPTLITGSFSVNTVVDKVLCVEVLAKDLERKDIALGISLAIK